MIGRFTLENLQRVLEKAAAEKRRVILLADTNERVNRLAEIIAPYIQQFADMDGIERIGSTLTCAEKENYFRSDHGVADDILYWDEDLPKEYLDEFLAKAEEYTEQEPVYIDPDAIRRFLDEYTITGGTE